MRLLLAAVAGLLSICCLKPPVALALFSTDKLLNVHDLTLAELVAFAGFGDECDNGDTACLKTAERDFTTWLLLADSEMYDVATMTERKINVKDARSDLFVCETEAKRSVSVRAQMAQNGKIRGVNLGGWLVLEPWIVPSMFYQFLGETDPDKVAMDPYTFCKVLGPEEGNKQMKRHWGTFLTETDIKELKKAGVNAFRLPVGDWMFVPYGPYVGCMDGALDQLDWLLDMATKYNIPVLIDVHTMKGGQNGLDNSGMVQDLIWVEPTEDIPAQFVHWDTRAAHWMGTYDRWLQHYVSFNFQNFKHSLKVISNIAEWYHDNPIIMGLEGVNEPWEHTPPNALGLFNWISYEIVQKGPAREWIWVMHDSFRATHPLWKDMFVGCDQVVVDTHVYQAWNGASPPDAYVSQACMYQSLAKVRQDFIPLFVGEWSLATDNCAMWLNGFQDNLGGYPVVPCRRVPCPPPYMGSEQVNSPPDPSVEHWWPIGTGNSTVIHGTCPVEGDVFGGDAYEEDVFVATLNTALLAAYHDIASGFFFWNFKTELAEPRWSFLHAWRRGWFPKHLSQLDQYQADGLFGMVCDLYPKPEIGAMFQPPEPAPHTGPKPTSPAPKPKSEPKDQNFTGGAETTTSNSEATETEAPCIGTDTRGVTSPTSSSTAQAAGGSGGGGDVGVEKGGEQEGNGEGPTSWPGKYAVEGGMVSVALIAIGGCLVGVLVSFLWGKWFGGGGAGTGKDVRRNGPYDRLA